MGYSKMLSKSDTASKADFNAFMLTTVEDGKNKGPGIVGVGVNMETGETIAEISAQAEGSRLRSG
jgi:hypothetical protein